MKIINQLIFAIFSISIIIFTPYCYADDYDFADTTFEKVATDVPTGAVHCFIELNDELYAGTDNRIFIEEDNQFKQVDNELKGKKVSHLVNFKGDLVANVAGELFTTSDMKTWEKLPSIPKDL